MKKIIGVSLALVFSAASIAQSNDQVQNKNGVDIMPVSGEWGVGMNALPILNYLGNSFNGNAGNFNLNGDKFTNYWGANTIYGKYMISDDNAIRAQLRIGHFSNTYDNWVYDDTKNSPDSVVLDTYKTTSSFYNIGAGYEFRRGKTRLKGIYGGEAMYMYQQSQNAEYTYGNAYGLGNQAPTATSWFSWGGVNSEAATAERVIWSENGAFHGVGLRGFLGVEYYILPKICIGTEFGWSFMWGTTGEGTTRMEYFDPTGTDADGNVGVTTWRDVTTAGNRGWMVDTDNFNGSLYMMFYF
jgi:hypothetical protein